MRFGKVHVNLGEPIRLEDVLARFEPEWRQRLVEDEARRFPWLTQAIDELAVTIMRTINSAATVTPVNLLAVLWGTGMTINLAWPRTEVYGEGVLRFVAFLFIGVVAGLGLLWYGLRGRHRIGTLPEHAARLEPGNAS